MAAHVTKTAEQTRQAHPIDFFNPAANQQLNKFYSQQYNSQDWQSVFTVKLKELSSNSEKMKPLMESVRAQSQRLVDNSVYHIVFEDLKGYRPKKGDTFVSQKANWLRGIFPENIRELTNLRGFKPRFIPAYYTSQLIWSTGERGERGYYVKL